MASEKMHLRPNHVQQDFVHATAQLYPSQMTAQLTISVLVFRVRNGAYKTLWNVFFVLNSAEYEIWPAIKPQITDKLTYLELCKVYP